MSSVASVDKLNIIYFGEMEIPAKEKKRRIAFASVFQQTMWKYYDIMRDMLLDRISSSGGAAITVDIAVMASALAKEYRRLVSIYYPEVAEYAAEWLETHSRQFAVWVTQTSENEPDFPLLERSITTVRTEVNQVGNLALLYLATQDGKHYKRWKIFGDGKERPSHKDAGGQTVPISEPFIVGGYQLMFPCDSSLGAPPQEIVNCRCTVEYI